MGLWRWLTSDNRPPRDRSTGRWCGLCGQALPAEQPPRRGGMDFCSELHEAEYVDRFMSY